MWLIKQITGGKDTHKTQKYNKRKESYMFTKIDM